jgi:hypothetical protein
LTAMLDEVSFYDEVKIGSNLTTVTIILLF